MVRITSLSDTTINDLSDIPFTIASAGVEAKQGNIIAQTSNPNAVTPQENIVAGTQFSLPLFQKLYGPLNYAEMFIQAICKQVLLILIL